MPGQLQGIVFKTVVRSLMTGQILFPGIKNEVDAMEDHKWYPWEDYKRIVNTIADRLPPIVVESVGRELIIQSQATMSAQGFTTLEPIFQNYQRVFELNVQGAPPEEGAWTESFSPGRAVICQGAVQPEKLIRGYFRGFIDVLQRRLISIQSEERGSIYRFEISWR